MFDSLLQTKLYLPPTRPDWVKRPRLLGRLEIQPQTKIILISAPAGYGKTTLVTNWLRQLDGIQSCWLSLDEEDNDPVRFMTYLVAALQHRLCLALHAFGATEIEPNIGRRVQVMLHRPQQLQLP